MTLTAPPPANPASFAARWQAAGCAERANYQLFLTELGDLLNLPLPDPATPDDSKNNYVFDRTITATNPDGTTSPNFIILCKRAHLVLETNQYIQSHFTPAESPGAEPPPTDSPTPADLPPATPKNLKRALCICGIKLWDDALLRAKSQ